jgi:hypothetical protein
MAANKQSSKTFQLSATQIQPLISVALKNMGAEILEQNPFSISAKTGMSFRSFGETIQVDIKTLEIGCQINIDSRCSMPSTLVDWGKNQHNIDDFFAQLERLTASVAPVKAVGSKKSQPLAAENKNLKIFISYRHEDSNYVSGRIYDNLINKLQNASIYKDVDSIPLGIDFREHIRNSVGQCTILLAVIGDHWAVNKDGINRLLDETDWVRIEVETALNRNIPVIPLLIDGAKIPTAEILPESLQALQFRNGMPIRPDPDFHNDMQRLIEGIEAC